MAKNAADGHSATRTSRTTETWLVTGASHGIGLEVRRQLLAERHEVVASGRRAAEALPLDFPDTGYISADLATAEGRAHLAANLPDRLDFALLNAGTGYYRPLVAEEPDAIARVLRTNLLAPIAIASAIFPLLDATDGVVGLVGSVAYKKAPGMPVYAASKAGLDGFGRSLRSEWQGRVDVRVIHPGPTATGMAQRAGLTSATSQRLMLPVADVAAGVIAAMRRPGRHRRTVSFCAVLAGRLRGTVMPVAR
ncbi:MAG: SDR family oxidoreductase [Rhizobiaceae bacterium]